MSADSPLETARYLMTAPGVDPDWREHASRLVDFVTWSLVDNVLPGPLRGIQWGARVVSEQAADHDRMVSHTTRYASVLALLAERTSNHSLGAIARRSWDWGSYMSSSAGRVVVGVSPNLRTKMWFSDSCKGRCLLGPLIARAAALICKASPSVDGDFIRNTMHTLAANASWAPAGESHILRSPVLDPLFSTVSRPFRTVFRGLGADFWNLGAKMEKLAKNRGKNDVKWARNGLKKVGPMTE